MMVVRKNKGQPQKTRGELRTEATRQALLDSAKMLFAKRGLDVTTINDITEAADVGKGTFYYHFKNKNELISDLVAEMMADLRAAMDSRCGSYEDLKDLLDCLIGVHINFFSRRWEDFVLFYQGKADLNLQEGYEGLDAHFAEYLDHMAGLLDSVIRYHLSKAALIRIACAVAGFVSGYYSFAVIASEEETVAETLTPVRGALVQGLSRFIRESIPAQNSSVKQ